MIYKKFSKRQILAMTWWNRPAFRDKDAIICDGSIRSGKTLCMTDGFFFWSMINFDHQSFGLCGRSVSSLRRNVINNITDWLGGIFQITEHRGDSKLTVRYQGRENTYYLFGGLDESSYKNIQGITLAGALLDEVALMPRSFVEQTVARCSVAGSKLWFNCNPAGPEHWFYKEWILEKQKKNALHLHFTMADNLALDAAIRLRYENMYAGVFYRRYILGEWCMADGLIYSFAAAQYVVTEPVAASSVKQLGIPAEDVLRKYGEWHISVDYGTRNPFSAGLWQVTDGKAYRIREYYHNGRETGRMLTDEEYCDALEALAENLPVEQVIVDPSAASLIAALRRRGRFSVRKARNEVLPGIRLVATLLKAGVLCIGPCCKDAIREFGLYRWEDKGEKDCVVDRKSVV